MKNQKRSTPELRELCANAQLFPPQVLHWIEQENLWNIWVPKQYGGQELSFSEGLNTLKSLAEIDGSLGWTITLCSGANYFIGNLQEEVAQEIFVDSETAVRFGGSGGVGGTADKKGEDYTISGTWRYATGAPYLTHFTLNAKITKDGKAVLEKDGKPKIRSFIVPKNKLKLFNDWDTMGMKASATYSFEVKDVVIHEKYSFLYDRFFLPQPIFKIPFSVFADLTLWVNYVGMAKHFVEEAAKIASEEELEDLSTFILTSEEKITRFAEEIEAAILDGNVLTSEYIEEVHKIASGAVHELSSSIIQLYPLLGIRESRESHPLNQVFRDYFTATQHRLFAGE